MNCSSPDPLSVGFPRQEYWSGLPFPSPADLPDPGIKPSPLTSLALAGRFFPTSATWKAPMVGGVKKKSDDQEDVLVNVRKPPSPGIPSMGQYTK